MKLNFDSLTQDQKIIAIRAYMAAGSPASEGLDFDFKVNGAPVDILKFIDAFVTGYEHDVRVAAAELVAKDIKLSKLRSVMQEAEYKIIEVLAEKFQLDSERVSDIVSQA